MLFPDTYQETVNAAKSGKCGEEWKSLMSSEKFMAIDASEETVHVQLR